MELTRNSKQDWKWEVFVKHENTATLPHLNSGHPRSKSQGICYVHEISWRCPWRIKGEAQRNDRTLQLVSQAEITSVRVEMRTWGRRALGGSLDSASLSLTTGESLSKGGIF